MKTLSRIFATVLLLALLLTLSWPGLGARAVDTNPGTTNLVACWDLNETSGVRYDAYGSNNLSDSNTVGYSTGVQGNAASFVNTNSEGLYIGDNAALEMGSSNFTIYSWVNLNSISTNQVLVSKWNNVHPAANREYLLYFATTNNTFNFQLSSSGATATAVASTNFGTPSISTWYFIVVKYDHSNMSISVNNGTPSAVSFTGDIFDGVGEFNLGSMDDRNQSFLNGLLDEVGIYKKALTADEISWLYNSGAGRSCSDINPPTPTPTQTASLTPTDTSTLTFTPTFTHTSTFTPSITFTPSETSTSSLTPSETPTETFTPTITSTSTETTTPTITLTPTITNTPPPYTILNTATLGDLFTINVQVISAIILVSLLLSILALLIFRRKS